jgi:hypothetical protein
MTNEFLWEIQCGNATPGTTLAREYFRVNVNIALTRISKCLYLEFEFTSFTCFPIIIIRRELEVK